MTRVQMLTLPLMAFDLVLVSALSVRSCRDLVHGALAAGSAIATSHHRGSRILGQSIPPDSYCVHGYSLHHLPVVWGCFGRTGTRSDAYYGAYFRVLYAFYNLSPKGPGCLEHTPRGYVEVDK
jgi:hypothetical protein